MTQPFNETSRAIKHLTQKSKKGNFDSSFQLYKNYFEGKNVEHKDEVLAKKYLDEVELALTHKMIRLKSVRLSEFRRFRHLAITFDPKITVIIGDNGAGKTSIAEALSKTFTWFNNNLEKEDVNGRPITHLDINVNATDYSEVTSKFQFDNKNILETTLARSVPGYTGSKSSDVNTIKRFASMYRHTAENQSILVPLLAFYSVERSDFKLASTIAEKASGDIVRNRFTALKDALEGSGKLEDFSQLYIELVNLAEGESTKEVQSLREDIHSYDLLISKVYKGEKPPEGDPYVKEVTLKKEALSKLLETNCSAKHQRQLRFVNKAIENVVPQVKHLEVDRSQGKPRLLLENFGNKVNISQLSQGQKMLVALTGDLARRLVTLNPDADEPLHGHGIVIIDEIELHLHPKWQQDILVGLQETFPNIQFIVTTHSPQVLSTVDNKCIRQLCLDESGDSSIKIPSFQTKGVTSADILARIMETNSIPEDIKEAQWVDQFSEHISDQNKAEAAKVLEKIINHFGEQHPVVLDCESQIRIAEMRSRLGKLD